MAFKLIIYLFASTLYIAKRFLPAIAVERLRMPAIFATSLLLLFKHESLSQRQRLWLFRRFGLNFWAAISDEMMARAIVGMKGRDQFLIEVDYYFKYWNFDPLALRLMRGVKAILSTKYNVEFPQYNQREIKESPEIGELLSKPKKIELRAFFQFSFNNPDKGKYVVPIADLHLKLGPQGEGSAVLCLEDAKITSKRRRGAHAVLYLDRPRFDDVPMEVLLKYKNITVLNNTTWAQGDIQRLLAKTLGRNTKITVSDPRKNYAAQYTDGNRAVSDFCDSFAETFVRGGLLTPSVRRFIPKSIDNALALDISDTIYRQIQRFYSFFTAINELDKHVPLFMLTTTVSSLPRALVQGGFTNVVILDAYQLEPGEIPVYNPAEQAGQSTNRHNFFALLRPQIHKLRDCFKALSDLGPKQIFVLANSRAYAYNLATKLVAERLEETCPVVILDSAPPPQKTANFNVSATLDIYSMLRGFEGNNELHHLTDFVSVLTAQTLNLCQFGDIPLQSLCLDLSTTIKRRMGSLIVITLLHRQMEIHIRSLTTAMALTVPGQHPPLRALAHAFKVQGRKTLDVQVLFVSEMARYRPPMAETVTVIDSFARELYLNTYNIPSDNIKTIGAIILDDDIRSAIAFGRQNSYEYMFDAPNGKVVTFACQPQPEKELLDSVKTLARYISARADMRLCVKLHPGQTQYLEDKISNILEQELGAVRMGQWCVKRKEPFWKVMPATDILVSFFSNVCLMAPAFDVPVVALPTTGPRPTLDLETIGIAYGVKNLDDLPETLDAVFHQKLSPEKHYPPQKYLSKNPHMHEPNSLDRLEKIALDLFVDT